MAEGAKGRKTTPGMCTSQDPTINPSSVSSLSHCRLRRGAGSAGSGSRVGWGGEQGRLGKGAGSAEEGSRDVGAGSRLKSILRLWDYIATLLSLSLSLMVIFYLSLSLYLSRSRVSSLIVCLSLLKKCSVKTGTHKQLLRERERERGEEGQPDRQTHTHTHSMLL